jgi:SPW repeat
MWLLGAPYALGYDPTAAAWNSTIVGILVIAVAVVRLFRPATTAWLSAVTLALGGGRRRTEAQSRVRATSVAGGPARAPARRVANGRALHSPM